MTQASNQRDDLQAKIDRYQDQLAQVESALTIDPSHADLRAIKRDLLEIIRILTNQLPLPVEDWEPKEDENTETSTTTTTTPEEKSKTEVKEVPEEIAKLAASYISAKRERTLTAVKVKSEDDSDGHVSMPGSSNGDGHTPDLEDYLNFRSHDKRMFNYLGKYAKKHGLKDIDKMPPDLKQFVTDILSRGGGPTGDDKGQGIPSFVHRDFRDISDRSLKNYLNKQKRRMREQEINLERAAQGLPPISLKNRKRKIEQSTTQPKQT